ncbi:phage holin family protein [Streptomyces paradoxus]
MSSMAPEPRQQDSSIGQLLSEMTSDVQTLFRQEVELAKAETREEARQGGQGRRNVRRSGVWRLHGRAVRLARGDVRPGQCDGHRMGSPDRHRDVGGVAAVLSVMGRSRMRKVSPKPEQTVQTMKEDAQWARHPTK